MDIIIVGGGVSGVVSAIYGSRGNNITILEGNDKLLKKLLITGNGRCNYYNEDISINNFHSNSNLLNKIINENNIRKVSDFYNELGIVSKVINGYYYPFSGLARTIYDALVEEVNYNNINIKYNYRVNSIKYINNKFIINNSLSCDKVVISTGSCSYPKTGSDGVGYSLLKSLGHSLVKPLPSLVPIKTDFKYRGELKGIRTDAITTLYEDGKFISKEIGQLQLTDYGLSGICIFNLSYWISKGLYNNKKEEVFVNFVPFIKEDYIEWFDSFSKKHKNKNIYNLLSGILNYKLVKVILKYSGISNNKYYSDLSSRERKILINNISNFRFNIVECLDYNHSQVCSGGLRLEEVNTNTLESLIVPGLYITGELLDITGNCGGYNLINAVNSGIIVGGEISAKSKTS